MPRALGEFEQLILLGLLRLGDEAYGAAIKREIEEKTGREVFIGAVYTALARMQKNGYVTSRIGEPTSKRGGRRKKFYSLAAAGEAALSRSYTALRSMAEGIEVQVESLAARRES